MIDWYNDEAFADYPTFGEEEGEDAFDQAEEDDQAEDWGWWEELEDAAGAVKDTIDRAVERVTEIPEEVVTQATQPALAYVDQMPEEPPRFGLFNLDAGAVATAALVTVGALFLADQLFARGAGTSALVGRLTGGQ